MKHVYYKIFLLVILTVLPLATQAQAVHISGRVFMTMKHLQGSNARAIPVSPTVYIFYNKEEARKQADLYRAAKKQMGAQFEIEGNDKVQPDYDGRFQADISPNGALVVSYGQEVKLIIIDSRLEYDIEFSGNEEGILLDQADVQGKRPGINVKEMPPIDDGPTLHWNVTVNLPAYHTTKHTRLYFQPVVVDINTKDTLQHLEPLIYEGKAYHINQNKRKSFDYNRNDSVAVFLNNETLPHNKPFSFNWKTTFVKPNIDHSYKWISNLVLEDYTHVLIVDSTHKGMERSRKPWKMLDVSMAKKEIELTEEYKENPQAQLREIPRDLLIFFEQGSDKLTADSANQINFDRLIKELSSYGRTLMNLTIQGTASPEGNTGFNQRLATKRAQRALDVIGTSIKSAGRQIKPALLYTWNDVADSLEARGQKTEADELREYASTKEIESINRMRKANPVIDEIMRNQRAMKCTYTIRENKALDPDEALWNYYNSPSYREGGEYTFSNGDFYNLFMQIKDSAELRKLTYRAYRQNAARRSQAFSPFAAYVANRMAVYAIEQDSIDTHILAPFVDLSSNLEVKRQVSFDNSYIYVVNRRAIVANQAIMYFKSKKLGEAMLLASKLPDTGEYQDIKMFTDLETLFFKQDKTPEETQRAQEALEYACRSSRLNNAVLNFELAHELGNDMKKDVKPLVDSLPDDLPQKWYMEGVIAAQDPEISNDNFMELVKKYGTTEALRMTEDQTPAHLAFFQHCFDINKKYKDYYDTDANIGDEVRTKYPYEEANAEKYRNKFNSLTRQNQSAGNINNLTSNDNDTNNL